MDNRRHVRKEITVPVLVSKDLENWESLALLDISQSGCLLEMADGFGIGDEIIIKSLPSEGGNSRRVRGKILRIYGRNMAIEFIEILEQP